MSIDTAVVAGKVHNCLTSVRQIAPFTDSLPHFNQIQAYEVTAALRSLRKASGEKPVGRKIGFTNRTIWEEYGVFAPIWGDVYDTTVSIPTPAHKASSVFRASANRALSRKSCSVWQGR